MTVRIVKHAFEIIHLTTSENPIQILLQAIINSGPREDSTRIGRAGTVRRQAVDVSPLRRVNQVTLTSQIFESYIKLYLSCFVKIPEILGINENRSDLNKIFKPYSTF